MGPSDAADVDPYLDWPTSALRAVLRDGAVTSVFQPIVELDSGHVVAYEALARGPEGPLWPALLPVGRVLQTATDSPGARRA